MATDYRAKTDTLLRQLDHARQQVVAERRDLKAAKARLAGVKEAQATAQLVAQGLQQSAHQQIAGIVTRCLRTVFGPDAYEFAIKFDRKRGKTEARLVFLQDGEEEDPLHESNGGSVDVAAFALRLAVLLLSSPKVRPLMVIDEPFKHVDEQDRLNLAQLLSVLADELGVQFIMVTHFKEFQIGTVYEI